MIRAFIFTCTLFLLVACSTKTLSPQTVTGHISDKYVYSYSKNLYAPLSEVLDTPKEYEPIGDLFFQVDGILYKVIKENFDSYVIGDQITLTLPPVYVQNPSRVTTIVHFNDTPIKQTNTMPLVADIAKVTKN